MAPAVSLAHPPTSFDSLWKPVEIPANETWIARATHDRAAATARMRELLEPHLTHRDDRDALLARVTPSLLYVPFWRVKLAVAGLHLTASARRHIDIGNISFPMPIPSVGGRAGVLMISARTAVPYAPRLPAFFGGTDALEVQRSELLPATNDRAIAALAEGEIVDADVDRTRGERTAAGTLVTMLAKPSAFHSVFEPRVESTLFVRYPLYFARFGDDGHFILLSARDGNVVSARFPRPPTLSERVRRLFRSAP